MRDTGRHITLILFTDSEDGVLLSMARRSPETLKSFPCHFRCRPEASLCAKQRRTENVRDRCEYVALRNRAMRSVYHFIHHGQLSRDLTTQYEVTILSKCLLTSAEDMEAQRTISKLARSIRVAGRTARGAVNCISLHCKADESVVTNATVALRNKSFLNT